MKHFISLLLLTISLSVAAQDNDPVVMSVNGKDIKKSEFVYSYNKNNTEESIERKSLDEYVELFKNFKLWIAEGETQKLDTLPSFLIELSEYRSQLAKPYLTDPEPDESVLKKEYERLKEMVELKHILFAFPGVPRSVKVLPSDTLETYKKAGDIMKRIQKGAKFEDLVAQYSEDPGNKDDSGYIGWFPGMSITRSLEDAAFTTPVGKSVLARSNYGYHILKINAKKPYPGQYNAAHILVSSLPDADTVQVSDALKKINQAYDKALKGEDFSELAKNYSDDKNNSEKGGNLGWFDFNIMVKEFQDAINSLKNIGDISKPFKTRYGYHIVKLLGKKPIEPYEEKKQEIEKQLGSGGFFIPTHQLEIDKIKEKSNFKKTEAAYNKLITASETIYPTDSIFYENFANDKDELFKIENTSFTIADFITFLKAYSRSPYVVSTELIVDRLENFEYEALNKVKEQNLENLYPEFKNLIQEYRDGIILFEIKNREVWDKASIDTEGLENYFVANKQKYAWEEPHFKGYVILAKDSKTKKKMQKETSKMKPEDAVKFLSDNYKVGDVSYVKFEKGLFKQGENAFVDQEIFKTGQAEFPEGFGDFFLIGKKLNEPASIDDVKGLIITDYQDYLEQEWIENLNRKYAVKIYQDVLNTLK